MCAVERDPLAVGVEVVAGVLELVGSAERRAAGALAPDHVLLLAETDAVPELDVLADDAHDLVGAAGGPGGLAAAATQTSSSISAESLVGGLAVPSRKANRLRGLLWGEGPRAAPEKPSIVPAQLQRAAYGAQQLAQRVRDRVALVGADLQQDVAVALRRVEVVDRRRSASVISSRGRWAREPVAAVEQRWRRRRSSRSARRAR